MVFEPFLPSCDGVHFSRKTTTRKLDARADILVSGLFQRFQDAYLDVAVLDTGAACYEKKTSRQVLAAKEISKRGKYEERVSLGGAFAPLVCSVYGTLGREASAILSRVVNGLDTGRPEKKDTAVMQAVYLQMAVVKATSRCLRARSRTVHQTALRSRRRSRMLVLPERIRSRLWPRSLPLSSFGSYLLMPVPLISSP